MRLVHLHLNGPISYTRSLALQNALLERHFRHKDFVRTHENAKRSEKVGQTGNQDGAGTEYGSTTTRSDASSNRMRLMSILEKQNSPFSNAVSNSYGQPSMDSDRASEDNTSAHSPDPTLITFSTAPTYTVGRRHLQTNPISASQQSFLSSSGAATFHASPRGGLLTYHAPGQLTGYVIADLRRHGITPRCWVRLLENSVMRTCAVLGVENTARTDDPGVWIRDTDRKICAIGVQVSRGITSHGVGLNIHDHPIPVEDAERYSFTDEQKASHSYDPITRGYLSWGFSRIVACGLEGKSVTWLRREQDLLGPLADNSSGSIKNLNLMSSVASVFATEVARSINDMKSPGKEFVDSVYRVDEDPS